MTALLLLLSASVFPPQDLRFTTSTAAVQVDVFVGRNGKAVLGLGTDDFEVRDDGVRQDVELVDVESAPLHIALVLDSSHSVDGVPLVHLKRAAHALLDGLGEGDQASLVSFSHHLSRNVSLTADMDRLHTAVDGVDAYGATAWHDALFAGLKTVEDVPDRPLVLLFTDGEDTYSWLREDQMLPLVARSDAVIYAIGRKELAPFEAGESTFARRRCWRDTRSEHSWRTRLLRELTEASGGRLIETETTEDLQEIFLRILTEMKTRYLLSYRPSGTVREGWHPIEVTVKAKGVDVQARGDISMKRLDSRRGRL